MTIIAIRQHVRHDHNYWKYLKNLKKGQTNDFHSAVSCFCGKHKSLSGKTNGIRLIIQVCYDTSPAHYLFSDLEWLNFSSVWSSGTKDWSLLSTSFTCFPCSQIIILTLSIHSIIYPFIHSFIHPPAIHSFHCTLDMIV